MNPEAMQKPIAYECADDANCCVADETEPVSSDDLARQPSGNDPHNQNYNQALVRQMHALPLFPSFRFAASWIHLLEDLGRGQTWELAGLSTREAGTDRGIADAP